MMNDAGIDRRSAKELLEILEREELPKDLPSMDFTMGEIYLQHAPPALAGMRERIIELACEADQGFARLIDNAASNGDLSGRRDLGAWMAAMRWAMDALEQKSDFGTLCSRAFLIDFSDGTEWGQGYFAFGDGRGSSPQKRCANPGAFERHERLVLAASEEMENAASQKRSPRI